jgi:hypothetical protein
MSDVSPSEFGKTPVVEVRICRDGNEVAPRFCESADAATDLVGQWEDLGATRIEVDDLSARHGMGHLLEPEREVDFGRADANPHDVVLRPEEPGR